MWKIYIYESWHIYIYSWHKFTSNSELLSTRLIALFGNCIQLLENNLLFHHQNWQSCIAIMFYHWNYIALRWQWYCFPRPTRSCGPFHQLDLTLISAWISDRICSKVWDRITYRFPNFNGCTVGVWEWISNFISHLILDVIIYPCWD